MFDIKEYEAMAKLRLPEKERLWVLERARTLFESFDALGGIDVAAVSPLVSVLDIVNIMREDAPEKLVSREELLANAPETNNGYFQVPKTLD